MRLFPPLVRAGLALGSLRRWGSGSVRREIGGADRDRTDDPLLAKQMLSQLSYSPGAGRGRNWRIEDAGLRNALLNPQFSILNRNGGPR